MLIPPRRGAILMGGRRRTSAVAISRNAWTPRPGTSSLSRKQMRSALFFWRLRAAAQAVVNAQNDMSITSLRRHKETPATQ